MLVWANKPGDKSRSGIFPFQNKKYANPPDEGLPVLQTSRKTNNFLSLISVQPILLA